MSGFVYFVLFLGLWYFYVTRRAKKKVTKMLKDLEDQARNTGNYKNGS